MPILHGFPSEFGQGSCFGVQVAKRHQRQGDAGHLTDQAPPYPGGTDDGLGADMPAIGMHRNHAAPDHVNTGYCGISIKPRGPAGLGLVGHSLGQLPGPCNAIAGRVQSTVNRVGQQRDFFADLVRAEQAGINAPGPASPDLALEVVEPLRRRRDFQSSDLKPQWLAVGWTKALVELGRFAGKDRHHARDIDLENEAGGVGGRAAGFEQGTLFQDHNVLPPQLPKVVGDTGTGDTGTDNNDPCVILHHSSFDYTTRPKRNALITTAIQSANRRIDE